MNEKKGAKILPRHLTMNCLRPWENELQRLTPPATSAWFSRTALFEALHRFMSCLWQGHVDRKIPATTQKRNSMVKPTMVVLHHLFPVHFQNSDETKICLVIVGKWLQKCVSPFNEKPGWRHAVALNFGCLVEWRFKNTTKTCAHRLKKR